MPKEERKDVLKEERKDVPKEEKKDVLKALQWWQK